MDVIVYAVFPRVVTQYTGWPMGSLYSLVNDRANLLNCHPHALYTGA